MTPTNPRRFPASAWLPIVVSLVLPGLALLVPAPPVRAQGANFRLPVDSIESLLRRGSFGRPNELEPLGAREGGSWRTSLRFEDGPEVPVKWAPAPEGGEAFNNAPRYDVAAYEVQKLFLEPGEYVVPPTVVRAVPPERYRRARGGPGPTFEGAESVLVVLQYFLSDVTDEDVFDTARFEADSVYARAWANTNLLTYLIQHNDSNEGNLLISTDPSEPRVFAVDNGLSFDSPWSNRGTRWRVLQVTRFPASSVFRLREVGTEELHRRLGVLAQWEVRDGLLVRVEPGENLDPETGIRRGDGVVQLGLTAGEIDGLWRRLRDFLRTVDQGRMTLF